MQRQLALIVLAVSTPLLLGIVHVQVALLECTQLRERKNARIVQLDATLVTLERHNQFLVLRVLLALRESTQTWVFQLAPIAPLANTHLLKLRLNA